MTPTKEQAEWAAAADGLYDDEIKHHHAAATESIKAAVKVSPTIWNCRRTRRECEGLVLDLARLRVDILNCSVRWHLQLNEWPQLFPDGRSNPMLQRGLERTADALRSAREATQDAESILTLRMSQSTYLLASLLAWVAIGITVVLGGVSIWVTLYPN